MPGTNAGTGEPIAFACAVERRERIWHDISQSLPKEHRVTPTGRTKARRTRGHIRHGNVAREYRCSCGHVGWSNHKDLGRMLARIT